MRILISGVSGFVGRGLLIELLKDETVELVGISRGDPDFQHERFKWIKVDITDINQIKTIDKKIDCVIHCAADTQISNEDKRYFQPNVKGTENLIEALNSAPEHFIYISSICAIEKPFFSYLRKDLLTEDSSAHPHTAYGKSKLEAENIVTTRCSELKIPYTILRPAYIYGPGARLKSGINTLILGIINNSIKFRLPFPARFSYIYIDDLCQAIKLVLANEKAHNKTYFVDSSTPIAFTELVTEIGRELNISHKFIWLPKFLFFLMEIPLVILYYIPVIKRKVPIHFREYFYDILVCSSESISRDLGFKAQVSYDEGIRNCIKDLKDRGYVKDNKN